MPDQQPPFGAFQPNGLVAKLVSMTRSMPTKGIGKRIGFMLRRLAIKMVRPNPLDVESFGVRFRLFPYNNVCEKRILFAPSQFDAQERQILSERVRDGFTFVDVGANIGGYALFVASLAGAAGKVLALEPQPDIFSRLVFNIRLNPFSNVKALACAVADKDGEVTLFIDRENKGESSVKLITAGSSGSLKVPARSLLGLLEDEGFTRLDAIKLDVEGAEDLILEAFYAKAPEKLYPSLIILERAPERWNVDLVALLGAKGYRKIAETRNNYVLERGFAAD